MGDKALESYQDALTELSNISDQHPYRAQLLLKMSNVLQRKGRLEEAEKILEELEKILQDPTAKYCVYKEEIQGIKKYL